MGELLRSDPDDELPISDVWNIPTHQVGRSNNGGKTHSEGKLLVVSDTHVRENHYNSPHPKESVGAQPSRSEEHSEKDSPAKAPKKRVRIISLETPACPPSRKKRKTDPKASGRSVKAKSAAHLSAGKRDESFEDEATMRFAF